VIRILIVAGLFLYIPYNVYSQDNEDNGAGVFKIFKARAEVDSMAQGYVYWKTLIKSGKINLKACEDCIVKGFDLRVTAYKVYKSDSGSVDPTLSGNFHSDSAQLSPKMIKAIRRAKEGTLKFSNIVALTPAKQEIKMNEVIIYIYPTKNYYKKKAVTYTY
jgi:hypothetical protein